jgi:hypothetical protein
MRSPRGAHPSITFFLAENGVSNEPELVRAAEATARAIISAECITWAEESIDDAEHIPRMRTIASAVGEAATGLGVGTRAAAELVKRLLQHAEDEYMQRWMAEVDDDEDPDAVREDGLQTFRRVIAGGRR